MSQRHGFYLTTQTLNQMKSQIKKTKHQFLETVQHGAFETTTQTRPNLVGVVLRHVVEVQLEQEVVLLQSAEHAGKAAGQAVHPAERRHAHLT